jgi:UDP-N-acetylmuramate--alanine ligase
MKPVDIDHISRIHFIGIGGIGMSALARHFLAEKKTVSGSDRTLSDITKALAAEGIRVFSEQVAENVDAGTELVVYTEAMDESHPEMRAARSLGVPMLNYFQALGLAMNPYYLIAVAGTHGKTTTTAMLADIFEQAGKDPTVVVGSLRAKSHSNYRAGKSKYAIVEACEYKRDFLSLKPDVLVITNVELEHVDYYESLADVQAAFRSLAEQVNEGGVIVTDLANELIAPVVHELDRRVIDYKTFLDPVLPLKQPGLHNRLNAAAALAVAKHEKLDTDAAKQAVRDFAGVWRRFEWKGTLNQASVYDDYAHHPTEISATIDGVRELHPDKRLVVVFEPHTFSRTQALFDRFAKALGAADEVVLLPIYAARETNESGVSSRELSVKLLEYTKQVSYQEGFDAAEAHLRATIGPNDVVVTMGAGTVTQLADRLTQ